MFLTGADKKSLIECPFNCGKLLNKNDLMLIYPDK